MTANDRLLPQSAWRAVIEAASPSEDEGLCRAKSRQRRRAVLAPLERAPRLRSGMRSIGLPLGDPRPLPTPKQPSASNRPFLHYPRSEEHTSELHSLMRSSYAVLCLKKKTKNHNTST